MVIGKLEPALLCAVGTIGIRLHLREDKVQASRERLCSPALPVCQGAG